MDRIPQDYLGGDLSLKSTAELKDLLNRQEKLLAKEKFLKTLPDKGKKVCDFAEKLKKLIDEKSDNKPCVEQDNPVISPVQQNNSIMTRDETVPIAVENHQEKRKPMSRFKKQGCDSKKLGYSKYVEEHKKFNALVKDEAKLIESGSFSDMMDTASQNDNLSSTVRDQVSISSIETALESMDISSGKQANDYLLDFIDRTKCNRKREPLKLNRDVKISNVKDLPNEFRPPNQTTSTEKTFKKNKSLFEEESAVCPPKYKYSAAKEMPLAESMKLQEEQSKRREESQALYAAERLAEKLHIKMDTFYPEGQYQNYREPVTMDSDDDLEGVD